MKPQIKDTPGMVVTPIPVHGKDAKISKRRINATLEYPGTNGKTVVVSVEAYEIIEFSRKEK